MALTAGLPGHGRSLSQCVPSRAIAAANREVMEATRETGGPTKKRGPYKKYCRGRDFQTSRLPA